ncbi:MAG: hypothetical protein ACRC2T_14445, partial [Thermoguttaceae bacterium]
MSRTTMCKNQGWNVLYLLCSMIFWLSLQSSLFAASPTDAEKHEANRWVQTKFEGKMEVEAPAACIQVIANNDPVFADARQGQPLKIGKKSFTKGL